MREYVGLQFYATNGFETANTTRYEDRLQIRNLPTLETRRIRGDQIEVFKIMHGYEGLYKNMFFRLETGNVRGHNCALATEHCKLDIRKYAFSSEQ